MKSILSKGIILFFTACLFLSLSCYGIEDPPDQLVGKWTKSLNERKVSFTISADYTYQVDFAGDAEIDVVGSSVISGNQITFTDEGGAYSSDEPGVYKFEVKNSTLTFTPVKDPVYGRSILMEGTWLKSGESEE